MPAFDCHPCCHSRSAGMACLNHWIPACAGMTAGAAGQELGRHGKGTVGIATNPFPLPIVIPAKAGIQEKPGGEGPAGFTGWDGNKLIPTPVVIPACLQQAGAGRNPGLQGCRPGGSDCRHHRPRSGSLSPALPCSGCLADTPLIRCLSLGDCLKSRVSPWFSFV